MKNKFLIIPGNNKLEKVSDSNFLFPLEGYATNLGQTFSLDKLPNQSYIYINRILNTEDIACLRVLLSEYKEKIKGIVFEDLGVLQIIIEENLPVEKILYLTHGMCSSKTANAFLQMVDTVILSNDITYEEIKEILKHVSKKIGLCIYAHLPYMYSRRTLLTNYAKNFAYDKKMVKKVKEPISKKEFLVTEDAYGTYFYDLLVYDGRRLLNEDVSYFILDLHLDMVDSMALWVAKFLKGEPIPNSTSGFLEEKTIVKLPPKGGV